MAQKTQLSVMGTPGRVHAFVAKGVAPAPTDGTRRQRQMKALIKSGKRRKC
jgi:hypothetical protein